MNWESAEVHLKEVESAYVSIGQPGRMALVISIWPIVDRFNAGERTEKLYNEIMSLE